MHHTYITRAGSNATSWHSHNRRQKHYNPPFWIRPSHLTRHWEDQNNQLPIPPYPSHSIHIPSIPNDAMIQRQSQTTKQAPGTSRGLHGNRTHDHARVQNPINSSPISRRHPAVVGWRSPPRETPPQKPLALSERPYRPRETDWFGCFGLTCPAAHAAHVRQTSIARVATSPPSQPARPAPCHQSAVQKLQSQSHFHPTQNGPFSSPSFPC